MAQFAGSIMVWGEASEWLNSCINITMAGVKKKGCFDVIGLKGANGAKRLSSNLDKQSIHAKLELDEFLSQLSWKDV